MGADDYMINPFGLRELFVRVWALLSQSRSDLAPTEKISNLLHFVDFTIDFETTEVRQGDQILNLTPTEYRLLVYLVRHAGRVFTREQILEPAWNDPYGVQSEQTNSQCICSTLATKN